MLPVIVPPIRKGICLFIMILKLHPKLLLYIQHPIIVVIVVSLGFSFVLIKLTRPLISKYDNLISEISFYQNYLLFKFIIIKLLKMILQLLIFLNILKI